VSYFHYRKENALLNRAQRQLHIYDIVVGVYILNSNVSVLKNRGNAPLFVIYINYYNSI